MERGQTIGVPIGKQNAGDESLAIPSNAQEYTATIKADRAKDATGDAAETREVLKLAENSAIATCQSKGNNNCVIVSSTFNGCETRGSLGHLCHATATAKGWYANKQNAGDKSLAIPSNAQEYTATIKADRAKDATGDAAETREVLKLAENSAIATCQSKGNNNCVIVSSTFNGCETRGSLGHLCHATATAKGWYSR